MLSIETRHVVMFLVSCGAGTRTQNPRNPLLNLPIFGFQQNRGRSQLEQEPTRITHASTNQLKWKWWLAKPVLPMFHPPKEWHLMKETMASLTDHANRAQ